MIQASVVLLSLLMISALLTLVMALAWRSFGQPRHAASWAAAFAVSGCQWAARLAFLGPAYPTAIEVLVFALLPVVAAGLVAVGFAQRARRSRREIEIIALCGVISLGVAIGSVVAGAHKLALLLPLLFRSGALLAALRYVPLSPGRTSLSERAVQGVLLLLAGHGVGSVLLLAGWSGTMLLTLGGSNRYLWMIGLPVGLIALGMVMILLLADDLAQRMRALATRDALTGVLNRRGFEEAAARMLASARRRRAPLCVAIADVDRFKLINDRFGHAAGDRTLVAIADHLEGTVREGDLCGRMGGEEFAIVLADTDERAGLEAMERIRAGIEALDREGMHVTASFGLAKLMPDDESITRVLERADRALYASKLAGRNRVTASSTLGEPATAPVFDRRAR